MHAEKPTIGMIGVGLMGHGIALNVIKKGGYPLVLLDHPGNQPIDDLLALGATKSANAADIARQANIVILCVTGTPQIEDVLFKPDGVLAGITPGTIIIDCSTAIPSSTLKVAEAVRQADGLFLDAPMTRTPKEAAEGRLNLLVGGDPALFERCLPLLKSYAENVTHAGPVGAGHRLKLLHNYVSLGFAAVLAEAAACAERTGVDPAVFTDVLAKGGGDGVALERMRPYIEAQDASRLKFSIANAYKDIGYYAAMAEETESPRDTALGVLHTYQQANTAGLGSLAVPEIIGFMAKG